MSNLFVQETGMKVGFFQDLLAFFAASANYFYIPYSCNGKNSKTTDKLR